MAINIIIGADMVPTKSNIELFSNGKDKELVGDEILHILESADYTIFNLEAPLYDGSTPINKCGPRLKAPQCTINAIKKINKGFFTLANNHIMDHGVDGLKSTISVLNRAGIDFSGAGKNLKEASEPFIKEINGKKIGIYCCAEHEFSIANSCNPGANPFDPLESFDHISALKDKVDFIIVLYHGGKEHYRYPSPDLQKTCRKFIEKGANLVVCQHSHCIGCHESWLGGEIIYGQGNFLFDDEDDEFWKTGILISLDIEAGGYKLNYLPINKENEKVRIANEEMAVEILDMFQNRSKELLEEGFVENQYRVFANSKIDGYLYMFSGNSLLKLVWRIINKLTGYRFNKYRMKYKYKQKDIAMLIDFLDCEAHRELILEGLKNKYE